MHQKRFLKIIIMVTVFILVFPNIYNISIKRGISIQTKQNIYKSSPFVITQNDDFSGFASTGNGSRSNPYVIANDVINSSGPSGINISNTDAYFRIENITINGSTDSGAAGIWLENVTNGYITNVTVTNSVYGFYLFNSDYITLVENNATANYHGFYNWAYCDHNIWINNTAAGHTGFGFQVRLSHNNTLSGNIAMGNGVYGFYMPNSNYNSLIGNNATNSGANGFILSSSDYNNLTDNTANGNQGDAGFYIAIGSDNNNISTCKSFDNTNGFYIRESNNNTVSECTAILNHENGFNMGETSDYNIIMNNTATKNEDDGVILTINCNFNRLEENNFSGNYKNGIELKNSHNNSLTDNILEENTVEGIYCSNSVNNTITKNIIKYNQDGIDLDNGSYTVISENAITENTVDGVYVSVSSNFNYITYNNISGNTEHGIYLDGVNNNSIIGNEITGNGYYGFEISSSDYNTFINNNVSFNIFYGFAVSGSNFNTFNSNLIVENTENGLELSGSNNNTIVKNILDNNTKYGIHLSATCSDNLAYFNILKENNLGNNQGYDEGDNSWINGTHGNYWSDYLGIDIDNNGIGDTNYTLDGGIKVNDTKPLVSKIQLTGQTEMIIEAGTTETIIWYPQSNFLSEGYDLYLENTVLFSTHWVSGNPIQINFDTTGIALDVNRNFTLVITDITGSIASFTTIVTIEDSISPEITYLGETDISFEYGTISNSFNATLTDLYPDIYIVYQNGSSIQSDSWISGTIITISLDDLEVGVYNYTLIVGDTSGNEAILNVFVTVTNLPISTEESTTSTPSATTSNTEIIPPPSQTDPLTTIIVLGTVGIAGIVGVYIWRKRKAKKTADKKP